MSISGTSVLGGTLAGYCLFEFVRARSITALIALVACSDVKRFNSDATVPAMPRHSS